MLDPELLLDAYRKGIFPMAVGERGHIGWFSPDPRAIIPLDDRFHIPHGLRRTLRKCWMEGLAPAQPKLESFNGHVSPGCSPSRTGFLVTFDNDFPAVIRACTRRREGTWISKEIIENYCELHRLGHAHSIEVWHRLIPPLRLRQSTSTSSFIPHPSSFQLAGGLYGVHIGGAFFGESMFHRATDASKVALVALVERLRARRFVLLDTQWQTLHLAQFGTCEIPKKEYLRRLQKAVNLDCQF